MTVLYPAPSPTAFATCLSLIAIAAALAGCGGGSDDAPQLDVALLAGDWQHQGCHVVSSNLSQRSLMRMVRQETTLFTQTYGALTYTNGDCTGSGTVGDFSPDTANQLVARRTASTGSLAIFWGYWTRDPVASPPYGRWVLKGDFMCPAFYGTPAIYPPPPPPEPHTYYDLELATRQTDEMLQHRACYTRLPA